MLNHTNTTVVIPTLNEGTASSMRFSTMITYHLEHQGIIGEELKEYRSNIFTTLALVNKKVDYPIIVVNDGSTDDTTNEVHRFIESDYNKNNVYLINNPTNLGKGGSFLNAMEYINTELPKTEHIILTDADILDPKDMFDILNTKISIDYGKGMRTCEFRTFSADDYKDEKDPIYYPDYGVISYEFTGNRIISNDARKNIIEEKGRDKVEKLLHYNCYGLEYALNLLIGVHPADTVQTSKYERAANLLPILLPSGRKLDTKEIVRQAFKTEDFYYELFRYTKVEKIQ